MNYLAGNSEKNVGFGLDLAGPDEKDGPGALRLENRNLTSGQPLRIAYLVNQYPQVSHTFIRREIHAAEHLGVTVERFALRGWDAEVVDEQDIAEHAKTKYTLKGGLLPLIGSALKTLFGRPAAFLKAAKAAYDMSRKSVRPLPYHMIYLAHACRIRRWLEETGVTHLHAHFGTNSAEIALLIKLLGGPSYSFTVHGPDEFDNAPFLSLDRKVAEAKFVVAISSYTRSQLLRHIDPKDWEKVKVVHCGLEAAFFDAHIAEIPDTQQLLCIGRLSGQKGHLILLEAFKTIAEKYPDCHLVFAGDGELRKPIEERMRQLGLDRRIRITGWISSDQVREELLQARALVQPSFQEGLPVVIMEAMAMHRPVISTYVAGIPELVLPGENGWLVPAGEISGLAHAMEACLNTPLDDLRHMGAAAAKRARCRHNIDSEAAKLTEYFAKPDMSPEQP